MARELEQIDIGLMKPEDAEGVVELFKAFYGDGYPVKTFYDAEKLAAENASHSILSMIAKNEAGKVVGHAALYLSSPNNKLYEQGAILVHPEYQGKRCSLKSIALAVTSEACSLAEKMTSAEGIFGEAVCNHIHTQKFAYRIGGFHETAFEVDLMPAEAYDKSGAATGRVSTLLIFRKVYDSVRDVYVPSRYKEQLEYIYEPLDISRNFQEASRNSVPLPSSKCSGKKQFFEFANTSRVTVFEIGRDFAGYVSDIENDTLEKGGEIFQSWLPLNSTWIEYALDILTDKGYFFGGVLPLWSGADSLLMQKIVHETDWDSQHIFSDRGKTIVDMVYRDFKKK